MSEPTVASRVDDFVAAISQLQLHASGAQPFEIDGLESVVSVAPESLAQVQKCLTEAHSSALRVAAVGSGAHLQLGNIPEALDVALSTGRLHRIVAHEPADMTVTVEAGVRLADLQHALAEHGQFLPLDPPGADRATVGGILAANVSGPLRHRYGTARDWLLGTRVVHADGSTSKSGGRVVKNVSGYDMHKVYVGSLGTLAVITEVTFKLAPLPKVDCTLAIASPSAAAAQSIISAGHERGLAVIGAELLSPTAASAVCDRGAWTALLRIAGGGAAVARTLDELHDYAALAEGESAEVPGAWDRWRAVFGPADLSLRVSVAPSDAGSIAENLDRRFVGDAAQISATSTAGLVRINLAPADDARAPAIVDHVREIAVERGGVAIVDAAPLAVKQLIDVFGPPRSDIEIMRRLKQRLDPERLLSPGRFVGRI
ncbi:MAG: FAD-binding oxidoreductase [Chloroflexi bacterium]|nr:FAD-binding oxidoreductase [Chloroflexota bacterium]